VLAGAVVSKLITYAITLTTAATLFAHGTHEIDTAEDAAKALEPIAGAAASWLFALGVIGTGMLAVPVLACSCAYATAEMRRWNASLQEHPKLAPKFYAVLLLATLLGVGLIYAGVPVVKMLFWASVLNGLLAPVAILLVVLLTRSSAVMGKHANPPWLTMLGWVSVLVTGAAALAMLASLAIAPEATASP
jgi:Mn2+/Fe2+ NRAMP family transporter